MNKTLLYELGRQRWVVALVCHQDYVGIVEDWFDELRDTRGRGTAVLPIEYQGTPLVYSPDLADSVLVRVGDHGLPEMVRVR